MQKLQIINVKVVSDQIAPTVAEPILAGLDSGAAADNSSNLVLAVGLVDRSVQDGQPTGHVFVTDDESIGLVEFDDGLFCAGCERGEKGGK